MTDVLPEPEPIAAPRPKPPASRARATLLKRLADVVCLPESRVNAFERAMTADLLVEMLREAELDERARVARRVSHLQEVPNCLVRLFLRDDPEVAGVLLEECASLTDADLVACVRDADVEHRKRVAARRGLSEIVSESLVERMESAVIEVLLKNTSARLSQPAVETVVTASRTDPRLAPLLLRRSELRPSSAYVMFWWLDAAGRRTVLQRFAVSREVLQDAVGDVFRLAAEEEWQEPLSRKALQFIERRQRNRAAADRSRYSSLEEAVTAASAGLTREIAEELAYLSGVKPTTGAKILADPGGEPIAILCKATGLPKTAVTALWRSMKRPEVDENGDLAPALERVLVTYEMIATDRAQTVLRYWNWALSSALTPRLVRAIRDQDDKVLDAFSVPQKAAMLALADDFAPG